MDIYEALKENGFTEEQIKVIQKIFNNIEDEDELIKSLNLFI